MLIKDQKIEVVWNGRTKKWFEEKGYTYTKLNDKFLVDVNDLTPQSGQRVRIICDYCGEEYTSTYYNYIKGINSNQKNACKHCASSKSHDITFEQNRDLHYNQLQKILSENGYELITPINEYTTTKMLIEYHCPKYGNQIGIFSNLLRGHFCNDCGNEIATLKMTLSSDEVEKNINAVNGNILLNKEEYVNAKTTNLKILCKCGNVFITSYNSYMYCDLANKTKCDSCSKNISTGESIIKRLLDEDYVYYIQEYRFDDCKDKRSLPFDFYLPDYNCCIEFDGEQHYRTAFGQEAFEKVQKHDKIKNEYCDKHSIKLIRIPYTEIKNIKSILSNELYLDIQERHSSRIKIKLPNNL